MEPLADTWGRRRRDAAYLADRGGTYGQDPIADFALSTDVYHEVGRRVAGLGLPTLVLRATQR